MEEKVNELLNEAFRIIGEDSDIIIIAQKDGKCGSIIHGSVDNNARTVFSFIHQPNNKVGQALYRILRLNVMNILGNWSPFADDLLESIDSLVKAVKGEEEIDDEVQ